MSHFLCTCGYDIRDISCPATHEARLVTAIEMDDMDPPDGRGGRRDFIASRDVMECPQCLCLWVQRAPREPKYLRFVADGEPLRLAEQQGGYRG